MSEVTPRLQSRSRGSRSVSISSRPFVQDPELEADAFIHPDGLIATALLNIEPDEPSVEREAEEALDEEQRWWKRPSPWWFLWITPFVSIAKAATMAPRVEIYIRLACDAHRPDSSTGESSDRWETCAHDRAVQAAVAKLALAIPISAGVLSCLTTAWWGSFSDRHGRVRVLISAVIGEIIEDLSFIFVCKFSTLLPGGYWLLTFGPTISGMLGGMSTVSAALHAYIADCTDAASRSRFFSLLLGLLFIGFSVGPTLGSFLISYSGEVLVVFYISAGLRTVYSFMLCFVIPESLTKQQMAGFQRKHRQGVRAQGRARSKGGLSVWFGRLFGFVRPLALLLPSKQGEAGRRGKRNWSLLLLAAGYGCTIALKGDITYEYQYMSLMFGWTSEQLGYYTSALGATRAIWLTILLPLIIKFVQPKPPAVQLPVAESEPLVSSRSSSPESAPPAAPTPPPLPPPARSPKFDLTLARLSILVEIVAYALMASAPNGYLFTAYAVLSALGIGFSPAVNSVASALYAQGGGQELGKLFGALGVVQTTCSQVVGPFLFGITYMRTVATAPKAIFAVSLAALTASFVLLAPIRLHKDTRGPEEWDVEDQDQELASEGITVAVTAECEPLLAGEDGERGRTTDKR